MYKYCISKIKKSKERERQKEKDVMNFLTIDLYLLYR